MPALPPINGVARIVVNQTLANVNIANVLHAYNGDGLTLSQSELDALATAVRAAWVTNVTPLQDADLVLTTVTALDLTSDTGLAGTASGSTPGTMAGTALPANAALCWSWKIANRYRGGHPRTYIAGTNQTGQLTANTWTTAYVASHLAAALALRTAVNATATDSSTWQLGCVSYYVNGALRPTPLFRPFTTATVDNRIDSQRRRLGPDR